MTLRARRRKAEKIIDLLRIYFFLLQGIYRPIIVRQYQRPADPRSADQRSDVPRASGTLGERSEKQIKLNVIKKAL
jgi:hypothetical protein